MILADIIAIAVPLIFLYLVRWLDLYASGSLRTVLLCFAWGGLAYFLSWQTNNAFVAFRLAGYVTALTLVAPIVEELAKSLVLVYYERRPDFTYFVDGAIYGFAAGSAFAIFENILLYVGSSSGETQLLTAVSRSFSTSLMHGSASALVGVAIGRLRFGHGGTRFASLVLGWLAAMAMHLTFNNVVNSPDLSPVLILAIGMLLAFGGVGLCVVFILWGLREEKRWLRESLHLDVGVSKSESAVVQRMEDLDVLLAPVGQRFGKEKQEQVEEFLKLQAKLGLKHRAQQMIQDEKLKARLQMEVGEIRQQMDKLRRHVGIYCMSYVRSILPPEATSVFELVAQKDLDRDAMEQGGVFALTTDRLKERLARTHTLEPESKISGTPS